MHIQCTSCVCMKPCISVKGIRITVILLYIHITTLSLLVFIQLIIKICFYISTYANQCSGNFKSKNWPCKSYLSGTRAMVSLYVCLNFSISAWYLTIIQSLSMLPIPGCIDNMFMLKIKKIISCFAALKVWYFLPVYDIFKTSLTFH